jgi:hypothetical protein
MSGSSKPTTATFSCKHCQKNIQVPLGLPPTKAPCPYCGQEVTSPDFSLRDQQVEPSPVPPEAQPEQVQSVPAGKVPVVQLVQPEIKTTPRVIKKTSEVSAQGAVSTEVKAAGAGMGKLVWLGLIVLLVLLGGGALWMIAQQPQEPLDAAPQVTQDTGPSAEELEEDWRIEGWKKEASEVLSAFMNASSVEEKMKYVIPNEEVLAELQQYYPSGSTDEDTPFKFFVHRSGVEEDRKRGIFRMQYRQPSQMNMKEYFAPIGSLDKVMGVQGATLIDMAYAINESNMSAPIEILAFFKKMDDGLKLDASSFIQSKFRTFRSFVDYPKMGHKEIFRVKISESIDHKYRDHKEFRTYRIEDFAYPDSYVNLSVRTDSEIGKILSSLNWRGMNRDYQLRTATVELGWSEQKPARLQIERFLCWEFLGVGGELGNDAESSGSADAKLAPTISGN